MRSLSLITVTFLSLGLVLPEERAIEILQAEKALAIDALWPGFSPLQVPVAIYNGERTVLARHPDPPAGFSPIPGHEGVSFITGRHPQVVANSTAVINNHRTATVMLNLSSHLPVSELAAIVVHESFHVYQWEHHSDWGADEAETFTYPIEDPLGLVYRRLEAKALHSALCAENGAESLSWAACAMDLRNKRFGRLTKNQVAYDKGFELVEGTAHYLEYLCQGKKPTRLAEEIHAQDVRSRNYIIGQAHCLLLDRFHPEWKERLEQGPAVSLGSLLNEVLAEKNPEPETFDSALIHEMEKKAEADIRGILSARDQEKQSFLNAEGWTLIVEVHQPEKVFWPAGFDPMNVNRLSDKEILHTRMIKLSGRAGTFEAMDIKTLTLGSGPHPLFNGVVRITVTGLKEAPKAIKKRDKVIIEGTGITAALKDAKVIKAGDKLTITIGKG